MPGLLVPQAAADLQHDPVNFDKLFAEFSHVWCEVALAGNWPLIKMP